MTATGPGSMPDWTMARSKGGAERDEGRARRLADDMTAVPGGGPDGMKAGP
ncbi:MAG: hypothetical protein LBT40_02950 [Deltaproteobacteria bacterium]|nr:hypothetical protein [Deltaproteobacteria bacterium]